jgi:SAM-dependent methyltransferase
VIDPDDKEFRHPLVLGQCKMCGLVQLTKHVPAEEIAPRFRWLKYNEPEGHLDDLAKVLCSLDGLPENPVACGITYKDDSLLRRLEKERFTRVWRIDPEIDLGITIRGVASETVIPRLTIQSVRELTIKKGRVNLIVARHVLEHAPETHKFLESIKYLLEPGGYILFEVPDCSLQLKAFDYCMLWEEHILYFVPQTLKNSVQHTPFRLSNYQKYSYPLENAMIAVVRQTDNDSDPANYEISISQQLAVGKAYAEAFKVSKVKIKKILANYRENVGKIAVFGAGHLSGMFINIMGIRDNIEFIVDDDPNKQNLFMPGSNLAIKGSNSLIEEKISLCLLSLSPESETKVIDRNKAFVKSGGVFASIFPSRTNSIPMDL